MLGQKKKQHIVPELSGNGFATPVPCAFQLCFPIRLDLAVCFSARCFLAMEPPMEDVTKPVNLLASHRLFLDSEFWGK